MSLPVEGDYYFPNPLVPIEGSPQMQRVMETRRLKLPRIVEQEGNRVRVQEWTLSDRRVRLLLVG